MQHWLAALVIGIIIGVNLGILAAALCQSAKDADEPRAQQRDGAEQQQEHREVIVVHAPLST